MLAVDPFPHAVIDDWFDRALLEAVAAEFPDPEHHGWKQYRNAQEGKLEGRPALWGDHTWSYFGQLRERAGELADLFGIPDLAMETIGGGYHLIPPGGYLAMHSDFNRSPDSGLYRRLNVLTYLNPGWGDPGGHLYLGAGREVDIVPEMGRTAIFATSATSWHGHPVPAGCWRRSVAAYFFSPAPPPGYDAEQSTVWLDEVA